jgi:hypothetical protein
MQRAEAAAGAPGRGRPLIRFCRSPSSTEGTARIIETTPTYMKQMRTLKTGPKYHKVGAITGSSIVSRM